MTKKPNLTTPKIPIPTTINPDIDGDGVPNLSDCAPFDPNRQHWLTDAFKSGYDRITSTYQSYQDRARRAADTAIGRLNIPTYRRTSGSSDYQPTNRPARRISGRGGSTRHTPTSRHTAPPPARINTSGKATTTKPKTKAAPKPNIFDEMNAALKAISTTGERISEKPVKGIGDIKPALERVARPFTTALQPRIEAAEKKLGLYQTVSEQKAHDTALTDYKVARYAVEVAQQPESTATESQKAALHRTADVEYAKYQKAYTDLEKASEHSKGITQKPLSVKGYSLQTLATEGAKVSESIDKWEIPYREKIPPSMMAPVEFLETKASQAASRMEAKTPGVGVMAGLLKTGVSHAFGMTALPAGAEAAIRQPGIIAPAAIVGITGMGKAAWHDPVQTAADLIIFGKVVKGVKTVTKPITPKILKAPGYTGIGIRGKTEPIPFVGIRSTSGIPAPKGVTTTYRGVTVGKQWTPVEYFKAGRIDTTPSPQGVLMSAQRASQIRVGKLRYEHQATAKGIMEGGYLLPKGRSPLKTPPREIATGERGLIPVEPIKYPLSTDVITPKALKPTRFYGEIHRPYTRFTDVGMYGSKARMRWMELGERRVIYGIKGAARQPKLEITTEGWTFRPTFPPFYGLRAGKATPPPSRVTGYAPKQIAPDMYFTKTPISSRFYDIGHLVKPTTAKPSPIPSPARTPHRAPTAFAEPATYKIPSCAGGVCPRDVGVSAPQMQRAPATKPAKSRGRPFAEPPKPSQTVERILKEATAKPSRKTTPARHRTAAEILAYTRLPQGVSLGVPSVLSAISPTPTPSKEDKQKRRGFVAPISTIAPTPTPSKEDKQKRRGFVVPHTATDPAGAGLFPVVIPYTVTEPDKEDRHIVPQPREYRQPPPPIPRVTTKTPPPPKIPVIKPKDADEDKNRKKSRKDRGDIGWHIRNPLITLASFMDTTPPAPKAKGKKRRKAPTEITPRGY